MHAVADSIWCRSFVNAVLLLHLATAGPLSELVACPFCTAVSQTMTERVAGVEVVVVAEVSDERTPTPPEAKRIEAVLRRFRILHVVKGKSHLDGIQEFSTLADPLAARYHCRGACH